VQVVGRRSDFSLDEECNGQTLSTRMVAMGAQGTLDK